MAGAFDRSFKTQRRGVRQNRRCFREQVGKRDRNPLGGSAIAFAHLGDFGQGDAHASSRLCRHTQQFGGIPIRHDRDLLVRI
jgi:hypothetical protein